MPNKNYTPKPPNYNPGEVGYRNRGNRTGLDPFDTYRESGRMEGLFYRHLLRGTLRTRNSMAIFALLVLGGIMTTAAMAMVASITQEEHYYSVRAVLCQGFIIVMIGGLGFLMLRAGLTNAAQLSGFTRWWRRQFKQTKKSRKK